MFTSRRHAAFRQLRTLLPQRCSCLRSSSFLSCSSAERHGLRHSRNTSTFPPKFDVLSVCTFARLHVCFERPMFYATPWRVLTCASGSPTAGASATWTAWVIPARPGHGSGGHEAIPLPGVHRAPCSVQGEGRVKSGERGAIPETHPEKIFNDSNPLVEKKAWEETCFRRCAPVSRCPHARLKNRDQVRAVCPIVSKQRPQCLVNEPARATVLRQCSQ